MSLLLELGEFFLVWLELSGLVLPFEKTLAAAYERWLKTPKDTEATAIRGTNF